MTSTPKEIAMTTTLTDPPDGPDWPYEITEDGVTLLDVEEIDFEEYRRDADLTAAEPDMDWPQWSHP
jgi:hypothetical protein